jgi:hypothetical protein
MKCTDCGEPIKPIVAIDIDGTLGQYHEQFHDFMENYFGRKLPGGWMGASDWEVHLGLSREQYREAKLAYRQGGFKRWMPLHHQADLIPKTAHERGAEVWITTTRPYLRLDSVDPDTREWLRRNRIYYDRLLYDERKYEKLLAIVGEGRVVAVVEDLPDQYGWAEACFGQGVPIMPVRTHNAAYRHGGTAQWMQTSKMISETIAIKIQEWKENNV